MSIQNTQKPYILKIKKILDDLNEEIEHALSSFKRLGGSGVELELNRWDYTIFVPSIQDLNILPLPLVFVMPEDDWGKTEEGNEEIYNLLKAYFSEKADFCLFDVATPLPENFRDFFLDLEEFFEDYDRYEEEDYNIYLLYDNPNNILIVDKKGIRFVHFNDFLNYYHEIYNLMMREDQDVYFTKAFSIMSTELKDLFISESRKRMYDRDYSFKFILKTLITFAFDL